MKDPIEALLRPRSIALRELDLNPVMCGPQGATAVDWLMVLDE